MSAPAPSPATKAPGFTFEGGQLFSFMSAVKEQCGLNLIKYADIEGDPGNLWIPKMRLQSTDFVKLTELYNQVSQDGDWYLGKWVVRGGSLNDVPNVIVWMPPRRTDDDFAVRAFSLSGLKKDQASSLLELISREQDNLVNKDVSSRHAQSFRGEAHLADGGQILVATGNKKYLQMVDALAEAFRQRPPGEQASAQTKVSEPKPER